MTTTELAKLRELMEKATPGPWQTDLAGNWDSVLGDSRHGGAGVACVKASDSGPSTDEECEANAALIAAMRNALPKLLAAAEELGEWKRIDSPDPLPLHTIRLRLSMLREMLEKAESELERARLVVEAARNWYACESRFLADYVEPLEDALRAYDSTSEVKP